MNWIILILAGMCEVGFTYCLGRAKNVAGMEWWAWILGFAVFTIASMALLAKATQTNRIGGVSVTFDTPPIFFQYSLLLYCSEAPQLLLDIGNF